MKMVTKYLGIVEFDVSDPPLRFYVGVNDSDDGTERSEANKAIDKAIELDKEENAGVDGYEPLNPDRANVILVDDGTIELCMKEASE